jgi:hypothetical protein
MERKRIEFHPQEIEVNLDEILRFSDFIFAEGLNIKQVTPEVLNLDIIPTAVITQSPFKALKKMQIPEEFIEKLKETAKYICPWLDNIYYGTLPIAVATFDKTKYKLLSKYELDTDWHKSFHGGGDVDKLFIPNILESSFMGHGYTIGTLPSDGSHTLTLCMIELPNKDYLICLTFAWHNK